MPRRTVQRWSLLAVVPLATVLRVYHLRDVPAGLYCDEAGLGYNAYAIATAGIDENGQSFPLFFWSFDVSYKNPAFVYAAVIPVALLGLDEFSVRLTSAMFGVGTVVAMLYLGDALFGPPVGLCAAVLLALCPWHLHFSRIAFELISFPFFFVIAVTLLVRFTQGRRTLPAAMVFFGACVYAYQIASLFVPLFLLGFVVLYPRMLLRRRQEAGLALAVLCVTIGPAAAFLYRHRDLATQYFLGTTILSGGQGLAPQATQFVRNYLAFFSPPFLFWSGDPLVRHAVPGFGELLSITAPCLVFGLVRAATRRERTDGLLLWWLVLYPVGPSLMTEVPSASRGIIGAPALCLLAASGVAAAWKTLHQWGGHRSVAPVVHRLALLGAIGVFTVQLLQYLRAYFVDYPRQSASGYAGFQYGYRDVIHDMESERSKYDLLMLTTTDTNQAQIFPLFYNRVDPRRWSTQHDCGYRVTDPAAFGQYSMDRHTLYALRPSDLLLFSRYSIRRRVAGPGGQAEFFVAEVLQRKQFVTDWLLLGPVAFAATDGPFDNRIDIENPVPSRGPVGAAAWRLVASDSVRVDLNQALAGHDPQQAGSLVEVCAYAAVTVRSPTPQPALLELTGSDDDLRVWLNGRSVGSGAVRLGDQIQRTAIDLNAGDNGLLLEDCHHAGDWYFTARIADSKRRDLPNVVTSAQLPPPPAAGGVAPLPPS